ncbi:HNH endonuclease signature motif containing protein [Aureimonas sp. AU20]|uniref:HNH endonuclease signature motif containing protein n=1 Tax=Aureimonas sp. AU20 TaxID=1349819 RepID=UPI00072216AE|nr:HNH endonuclease signature motif containing protein [Aureimonas sp. AU20]ALN73584.1 restriction endonuclease [Aureimonas sp. AU20]
MPSKPGRICACGNKVAGGELCQCQRQANRERKARHDASRPSAAARGYDGKWRMARLAYLAIHRTCRMCDEPATVVDHIIPHRGDFSKGGLFWNRRNWQPLCAHCHNSKKQAAEKGGSS